MAVFFIESSLIIFKIFCWIFLYNSPKSKIAHYQKISNKATFSFSSDLHYHFITADAQVKPEPNAVNTTVSPC